MKHHYAYSILPIAFVALVCSAEAVADPVLSLENITLEQGQSAVLPVNASGIDPSWSGINATIQLPPGVEVSNVTAPTMSAFDFDYYYNPSSNQVSLILLSPTQTFGTGAFEVAQLKVHANQAVAEGQFPVTFVSGLSGISNATGSQSQPHTTLDAMLTVVLSTVPLQALPLAPLLALLGAFYLRKCQAKLPIHISQDGSLPSV